MNTYLFVAAGLIAVAQGSTVPLAAATTLVRAPAHDSASIEHHRLGGNFAYSTAESHAFASVTPQVSTITHPVAETTHTHIPAPIETYQPAPVVRTHHVAQPIFKNIPVHAEVPVTGPVATHRTVHQPVVHETRTHTVQTVAHAAPAIATVAAAAPVAAVNYAAAPVANIGYAAAAPVAGLGYAAAPGLAIAH